MISPLQLSFVGHSKGISLPNILCGIVGNRCTNTGHLVKLPCMDILDLNSNLTLSLTEAWLSLVSACFYGYFGFKIKPDFLTVRKFSFHFQPAFSHSRSCNVLMVNTPLHCLCRSAVGVLAAHASNERQSRLNWVCVANMVELRCHASSTNLKP